jgi:hypothetical protein
MPTVPGTAVPTSALNPSQKPSVEQLLMTAADMQSRGQLYQEPTSYSDPKASLTLPSGGGRGPRVGKKSKRR